MVRQPHDHGLWLDGIDALRGLPDDVNAVVSLCRLGTSEVLAPGVAAADHVEVWLVDIAHVLPLTQPNAFFQEALERLSD